MYVYKISIFQKPTDELGRCYVTFMRGGLEQIRLKIADELFTLTIYEVITYIDFCCTICDNCFKSQMEKNVYLYKSMFV